MKIETISMLSYESRVQVRLRVKSLRKLQVGLVMKVEIASLLNYENRDCKYASL